MVRMVLDALVDITFVGMLLGLIGSFIYLAYKAYKEIK